MQYFKSEKPHHMLAHRIYTEIEVSGMPYEFRFNLFWKEISESEYIDQEINEGRMTELPKYWCVKNDGSKMFKDIVIRYLNDKYNRGYDGSALDNFYGYDGKQYGAGCHTRKENFLDDPTELTIEQFIKLTTQNKIQLTTTVEKVKKTIIQYPESKQGIEQLFPEVKEQTFKLGDKFISLNDKYEYTLCKYFGSTRIALVDISHGYIYETHIGSVYDTSNIPYSILKETIENFNLVKI